MKKTTTKKKIVAKKASVSKKAPAKKLVVKKKPVRVAKKTVSKKKINSKKPSFFKPIGILVAVGGVLGLVALLSVGLTNLLAPSTKDDPVLGATTANTNSLVATPTGVRASISSKGILVSWTQASGIDNYAIYRKDGLSGTIKQIASNMRPVEFVDGVESYSTTKSPLNYFLDTTALKNKFYTYFVSSSKRIGDGLGMSKKSTGALVWNYYAPTMAGVLTATSTTAKSITIDGALNKDYGYYAKIASSGAAEYSRRFSLVTSTDQANMSYSASGVLFDLGNNAHGHTQFQVTSLNPGTEYSVNLTMFKAQGFSTASPKTGTVYETILTNTSHRTLTTSSTVVTPKLPTGFKFGGMAITGSIHFEWNIPAAPAEGYNLSVICKKAGSEVFSWSSDYLPGGPLTPFVARYTSNPTKPFYEYDIEDATAARDSDSCTAQLTAYNISSTTYRLMPIAASIKFNGVTAPGGTAYTPADPTGVSVDGIVVDSVDHTYKGGPLVVRWDKPSTPVDGYRLSASCLDDTATRAKNWASDIGLVKMYSSPYIYDIPTDMGISTKGYCNFSITAYNNSPTGKLYSATVKSTSFNYAF